MARRGRPSGIDRARELVSLVGSLSAEGDTISAEVISSRLGISLEEARHDLTLILTASTAQDEYLPLYGRGDAYDRLTMGSSIVRGRPLRLTRLEATAVLSALNEAGMDEDDPIRVGLEASLGPAGFDADTVRSAVEAEADPAQSATLQTCARAISQGSSLEFEYQGTLDAEPRRRHVSPEGIRRERDLTYLDAYDLDARGPRCFRIDRMAGVGIGGYAPEPGSEEPTPARSVTLAFSQVLDSDTDTFPGLMLGEKNPDGTASGRAPYYGGTWLARRIAATGGRVTTTDPELDALVRSEAARLLALLDARLS